MDDTVLAGPIEFSPAEIAFILAVLAALFVAVTAPGWAALGWAFARRRRAKGPGAVWPHALGGFAAGVVVSGIVSAAVGWLWAGGGSAVGVVAVLLSWAACWALAWAIRPAAPSPPAGGLRPEPEGSPSGWGRDA